MSLTFPKTQRERVWLVTGAGDGLGRAVAIAAARTGATVVLVGRTVKKLEATYDAVVAAGGPPPVIHPMNLVGATWADHFETISVIERELGRLDMLVHCAAHFPGFAPLSEEKPKDWLDGLQANLSAPYALTRHALPLLLKSPAANVVFVTDGAAPKAFRGAYGVAKHALIALAETWRLELRMHPNLRVETFDPGPMRTAIRRKGYPGEDAERLPLPAAAAERLLAQIAVAAAQT